MSCHSPYLKVCHAQCPEISPASRMCWIPLSQLFMVPDLAQLSGADLYNTSKLFLFYKKDTHM